MSADNGIHRARVADETGPELERLQGLIDRAEKTNKPEDRALARRASGEFLDRHPELLKHNGDMAARVEQDLVEALAGKYVGVAVERELARLRQDLGYEKAAALERLLIDRLLVSWLRVQQAERQKSAHEENGVSQRWALAWDKRLEIANKNFLRAVRTLALVRRKPVPLVVAQVNIGTPGTGNPQAQGPIGT